MTNVEFLYPAENAFRHHRLLNGTWFFAFDQEHKGNWESGIPHDKTVPVPAAIQDVFLKPEEANWCGNIWYEKNFFVPKEWLGEDVFLRFDGIGRKGIVYLNGLEIARHEGTYIAAIIDITKHARYGEDNKLVVKVNTEATPQDLLAGSTRTLPSGRKVNTLSPVLMALQKRISALPGNMSGNVPLVGQAIPHGLIGNVQIYSLPQNRILDISVQTTEASPHKAVVQYMVQVQGNCLVTATLRDSEGRVVATGVGGNANLVLDKPNLWEPGKPYLYSIDFEVSRLGKQHDFYKIPFGVRKVELKHGKFTLNGQAFTIRGERLWQTEDSLSGLSAAKVYRQMQKLLHAGGNCVFAGGYTLPKYILDIADELGLFVIAEMPVTELSSANTSFTGLAQERYLESLKHVMQRDKNHPSLLMWNVFNAPQITTKEDETYLLNLIEHVRKLDWQNRPVGLTTYQTLKELPEELVNACDVMVMNHWLYNCGMDAEDLQQDMYEELIKWQAKYTERILFIALPGCPNIVNMAGLGYIVEETETYYTGILDMLTSMPLVKGCLMYNTCLLQPEILKALWLK